MKKAISYIMVAEGFVILSYLYSFLFFINLQVAFLSSLFVILGASYAYAKMVKKDIEAKNIEERRDLLDSIEDPYELYEDTVINEAPAEELDLKEIVKEEKAKIKTFSLSSMKYGSKGSVSAFRLLPYLFLIFGFIALKNNGVLDLSIYLPSLLIGIIVGSLSSKEFIN